MIGIFGLTNYVKVMFQNIPGMVWIIEDLFGFTTLRKSWRVHKTYCYKISVEVTGLTLH